MSELFNRLICEWFHGGGSVTRDSNGRINWQCHRCGRWSAPVSHKEEAAMIDRDLAIDAKATITTLAAENAAMARARAMAMVGLKAEGV